MESKGINDFLNELKLARENSLLGNYEDSLKKYKSSANLIQRYLMLIHSIRSHLLILNDVSVKQKWKMVLDTINREMGMTNETLNLKKNFSVNLLSVINICRGVLAIHYKVRKRQRQRECQLT